MTNVMFYSADVSFQKIIKLILASLGTLIIIYVTKLAYLEDKKWTQILCWRSLKAKG